MHPSGKFEGCYYQLLDKIDTGKSGDLYLVLLWDFKKNKVDNLYTGKVILEPKLIGKNSDEAILKRRIQLAMFKKAASPACVTLIE